MHHLPPWTDYAYSREVVLAFADDADLLDYLATEYLANDGEAHPSSPSPPVVVEKKPGPMATTTRTRCRSIIRRPSKWSSHSSRFSRLMPPSSA